jgi:hypothetical protein
MYEATISKKKTGQTPTTQLPIPTLLYFEPVAST